MKARLILLVGLLILSGCATNGEIGFKNHPIDCAAGFVHSDCLPGTAGYANGVGAGLTDEQIRQKLYGQIGGQIGATASSMGESLQSVGNARNNSASAYGNAAAYQQQSIIQQQQQQAQQSQQTMQNLDNALHYNQPPPLPPGPANLPAFRGGDGQYYTPVPAIAP